MRRVENVCCTPAAYKSTRGDNVTVSFQLPDGGLPGASVFFHSADFSIEDAHDYYRNFQCNEVLAQGVIIAVNGLQASIGWLRMVQKTKLHGRAQWAIGDLAQGGMDAFREVSLGGYAFQLIPVFRWEAPEDALTLLDTIQEQKASPVQINEFHFAGGDLCLSLSLLSGQEFEVTVEAGVPVMEMAPRILEALGRGPDPSSSVKWFLHLIMPDGRLLQLHDRLPVHCRSPPAASAVNSPFAAALSN